MNLLVSPAEPAELKDLGTVSPVCEQLSTDFIISSPEGLIGVQRKTLNDLVSSVHDGRLTLAVMQMSQLYAGILLVEGRPKVTRDGELLGLNWTIAQFRGILWSVRAQGYWVDFTDDTRDTAAWLTQMVRWAAKGEHVSVLRRPTPKSPWGKRGSQEQLAYALQAVSGLGYQTAMKIVKASNGQALRLNMSKQQLLAIEGIGPKRAEQIIEVFGVSEQR